MFILKASHSSLFYLQTIATLATVRFERLRRLSEVDTQYWSHAHSEANSASISPWSPGECGVTVVQLVFDKCNSLAILQWGVLSASAQPWAARRYGRSGLRWMWQTQEVLPMTGMTSTREYLRKLRFDLKALTPIWKCVVRCIGKDTLPFIFYNIKTLFDMILTKHDKREWLLHKIQSLPFNPKFYSNIIQREFFQTSNNHYHYISNGISWSLGKIYGNGISIIDLGNISSVNSGIIMFELIYR